MPLRTAGWALFGALALVAAAPRPVPSPSPPAVYLDVPIGLRFEVKLDQRISTQDNSTGQHFSFETTQEFMAGDIVVPRGVTPFYLPRRPVRIPRRIWARTRVSAACRCSAPWSCSMRTRAATSC